MSSRAKRATKAATAAASAAAPAPVAAAAPAKSKGRRRKAEEPEEKEAAVASAHVEEEEKSSISVPSSKRARASSPAPRKQAKAASKASASASSSSSAAAAAASSSSAAAADPLSAQWSSFLCPSSPLPLRLLFESVFSLLSLRDLAVGLAAASNAGLAEMNRFADYCRAEQDRDALLFPIVPRKKSKVVPPPAPQPPPLSASSLRTLLFSKERFPRSSPLFSSPLRCLVQAVHVSSGVLDTTEVNDIARKLPFIVSLTVDLSSSVIQPHFAFPSRLQHLSVVPHRLVPSGKSNDVAWEYVSIILEAAAALQHLRSLTLRTSHLSGFGWGLSTDPKWLRPLAAMAGPIESLTLGGSLVSCVPLLNSLPSLTELKSIDTNYGYEAALTKWLAEDPPSDLAIRELPLGGVEIKDDALSCFRSSLTDLRPKAWGTPEIGWVVSFKSLRRIRFAFVVHPYDEGDSAAQCNPSIGSVVEVITQLRSLTDVCVRYTDLTDAHFERMLNALPQLTALELQSDCITSLEPLSLHAQLPRQMRQLTIELPQVPRDHIAHIMRLTELESLNIAGSFTEPLYAKQLAPFLPPYPREPMHWLRSFTPRSDREAVPAPPVDLVARAAEHAAFDARVRAGEVRSAELLNAAQLSGVLTFLDCSDFSRGGRSCRAWRAAACLPSAWSLKSNLAAASSINDGDNESGQSWLERRRCRVNPLFFLGHARILVLSALSPQFSCAILPHAPLWKHACALRLYNLQTRDAGQLFSEQRQPTPVDNPLATLCALSRLEALDVAWPHWTNEAEIDACMAVIGPRLKRANFVCLPNASLHWMSSVHHLHLSGMPRLENSPTRACPDRELLQLHRLRSLQLMYTRWEAGLGRTLRALSQRHLRDLSVVLSDAQPRFGWMMNPLPSHEALRGVTSSVFLPLLLAQLAGVENADVGKDQAPAAAVAAATGLDDDAESSLESTTPSLLESLRIESTSHFAQLLSFAPLVRLPRLRSLDLRLDRCTLNDLFAIVEAERRGDPLPPLEFLSLRINIGGLSVAELARLSTLREMILISTNRLDLPLGFTALWAKGLPMLELLSLRNVEFRVGAFAHLSRMPRLRSLSLSHASLGLGAATEMESLAAFPALEELTLEVVEGLILQQQDWMVAMGKPVEGAAEAGAGVDAVDGAAAAASSETPLSFGFSSNSPLAPRAPSFIPVLPVVARCALLRVFRWEPTEATLKSNADYTSAHSWLPAKGYKSVEWQQRNVKERRRERQILRRFMQQQNERRRHSADPLLPPLRIELAGSFSSSPSSALALKPSPTHAVAEPSKSAGQLPAGDGDEMKDDADKAETSSAPATAAAPSLSSSAAAALPAASAEVFAPLTEGETLACHDDEDERAEQAEQAKAKLKAEKLAAIDPNAPAPKRKAKRRY